MPDLDDLSNFSEGMHVNPLPAPEVRRRGDRMRRRNTAAAAVGGVVAAAVFIGTPIALMNSGDSDGVQPAPPAPTQTDTSTPAWLTEIPEGFPVTEGMVTGDGGLAEGGTDALNLCDTAYPTSRGTEVTRTWSYSDDGESYVRRTLQLWRDNVAAYRSVAEVEEAVQACPQQPTPGGEEIIESKLVEFDTGGDASLTFVQQIVGDDGLVSQLTTVQVTQVGNAVLVASSYGAAGGDQAIDIATKVLASSTETTRAAMCVFSSDPCSGPVTDPETSEPPVASGTAAIPAGFPLAESLDDGGDSDVEGPDPDVEGAPVVDVCGTAVWQPSLVVERLAARETGIEYLETRELFTFPTADEASESVTQVREAVTACPRLDGESYDYTTKVLDGPEGYDSFTWGSFADESLDGGVFQITRVGASVLVLYAAGETSEASLQPVADNLTEASLELAPEMCLFTEDGC
jgi:ferredoxin